MKEDFQARIARLEAKGRTTTPQAEGPAPTSVAAPEPRSHPRKKVATRRMTAFVLGSAVALLGLPAAAVFGTIYYAQNQDNIDRVMARYNLLKTAETAAVEDTSSDEADVSAVLPVSSTPKLDPVSAYPRSSAQGTVDLLKF